MSAERYRLNSEVATAKVIDGEAIVINVVTGRYYSLDGTAGAAWALLVSGHTVDEAAAQLAARYGVDVERVAADLTELLADLESEDLVTPAPDGVAEPDGSALNGASGEYSKPMLAKFTDMEDLLAFDPPLPPSDSDVWESASSAG